MANNNIRAAGTLALILGSIALRFLIFGGMCVLAIKFFRWVF